MQSSTGCDRTLSASASDRASSAEVEARLRAILSELDGSDINGGAASEDVDLQAAIDDEMFGLIDEELASS